MSGAPSELRPKQTNTMTLLKQDDYFNLVSSRVRRYVGGNERGASIDKQLQIMELLQSKFRLYSTLKTFDWTGVSEATRVEVMQ